MRGRGESVVRGGGGGCSRGRSMEDKFETNEIRDYFIVFLLFQNRAILENR